MTAMIAGDRILRFQGTLDNSTEDQLARPKELEEHGSYQGISKRTNLLRRWCNTSIPLIHDTLFPCLRLSTSWVLKEV